MKLTMSPDLGSMLFDVEPANTNEKRAQQETFRLEVVRLCERVAINAVVSLTPCGLRVAPECSSDAIKLYEELAPIVANDDTLCPRCDDRLVEGRCIPCAYLCAEQIELAQDGLIGA